MTDLTHLSLFSGIGGLDLAAEWAGFRTVGQCEFADYPTRVLEKHWPGAPRWRDIRTLTREGFYERTGLRTVDVISGGFPCQPFSVAGKRRGKEDDRYLWPEMLRVISEIRPTWVIGENVAGIVTMALDQVLSDLESIGYACQALIIPACAIDAPHRRDRCAIVAYHAGKGERSLPIQPRAARSPCVDIDGRGTDVADTDKIRCDLRRSEGQGVQRQNTTRYETAPGGKDVPNADRQRLQISRHESREQTVQTANGVELGGWWPVEPGVGRVAYGIPYRVDRLRCLGNAVVPQQFYPIFAGIAEIERTCANG